MARQARAQAIRRRVLAAAVEAISERGYCEIRLSDSTEHSGLSNGAVRYHFAAEPGVAAPLIES